MYFKYSKFRFEKASLDQQSLKNTNFAEHTFDWKL